MVPVPKEPLWPEMEDVTRPTTRTMPLVDPGDPFWKKIKDWLFKKPLYIITHDYFTYCPMLKAWIFIPENFVYDYASIPRFLTFVLRPNGILGYGAGPHDFGCRFAGMMISYGDKNPYTFTDFTKDEIDDVFGDLNNKSNGLKPINNLATWTVKAFGGDLDPIDIDTVDWSEPVYGRHY